MKTPTKKWFIRSIVNLGTFCDYTKNTEPSMTDPSQDESIDSLVARLMRGEIMSHGSPSYDVPNGSEMSPNDVFTAQPVVERDGFDIADSGPILAAGSAAIKSIPQPVVSPAAVVIPPVVETPLPDK